MDVNGVKVIIANGKGVSIYNESGLKDAPLTGWVWKFRANSRIPFELKLVNDREGHYHIAPTRNMPIDKYKGLLEEMGMSAQKVFRKKA